MESRAEFQELLQRVEKLEMLNRRWRLVAIVLLQCVLSTFLMASKASDAPALAVIRADTVEARDIVVTDKKGNICARLTAVPKTERMNNGVTDRAVLTIYSDRGLPVWTAPPSPRLLPAAERNDMVD